MRYNLYTYNPNDEKFVKSFSEFLEALSKSDNLSTQEEIDNRQFTGKVSIAAPRKFDYDMIDHYVINESSRIDKRTGKKFGPTVVVFYKDGTATHATLHEGDNFDLAMGIAVCVLKKVTGDDSFSKINKIIHAQEKRLADDKKAVEERRQRHVELNNKNKKIEREAYLNAVKDRAKFEYDVEQAKKQLSKKIVD